MTPKQTESLLKLMSSLGVYHLKTPLIEAHIKPQDASGSIVEDKSTSPIRSPQESIVGAPSPVKEVIGESDTTEIDIPHTDEELASLMKLSDQELLNRLIPDAPPEQE